MGSLLLIDEDARSCREIADYLGAEGFETASIHDGGEALGAILTLTGKEYDLILLDLELPGANGFEVLRAIRSRHNTPVILVAANTRSVDCIVGLENGADDFMAKPIDPRELLARVRAILRRAAKVSRAGPRASDRIILGDIELDAGSRIVRRNGEELQLTAAEFSFLELLVRAAGHVVSRELLARNGLGRDLGACDRSVDMHVSRIRKKLGHEHNGIERIKTVRGSGFIYTIPHRFKSL